jgi:hypothetical protein
MTFSVCRIFLASTRDRVLDRLLPMLEEVRTAFGKCVEGGVRPRSVTP